MQIAGKGLCKIIKAEKTPKKYLTKKTKKNKSRNGFIKIILDEIISSTINEKYP
jgi:hypothetical protein